MTQFFITLSKDLTLNGKLMKINEKNDTIMTPDEYFRTKKVDGFPVKTKFQGYIGGFSFTDGGNIDYLCESRIFQVEIPK